MTTETKPLDIPSVGEQIEINKKINERLKASKLPKPYYEDDFVTIYNGDCRLIVPYIENIGQIQTDPPYGISLVPPRGKTKSIAGDGRRDAKSLLWFLMPYLHAMVPDNSAHFFFAGWSETWVKDVLQEWFTVKSCIVWEKNQFGIGYHTRPKHEFAWLVHKGEPPPPANAEADIWKFDKVHCPEHSCEKPVDLIRKAILYYETSGTILDPFMGSGTTLRAAKDLGRKAIGIEIEEQYCEIAARRMSQEVLAL